MSDTEMDTPAASHTMKVTSKSNKPDIYNGERNKLESWLLQVDRYFHLEGDKIDDNDMVVWATTFLRGNAGEWVTPIIRRYMDDTIEDTDNKNLVEDWDTFKAKMREVFSPFQETVIAEQKIQQLRQTHSAADYTTQFQQYQVVINWDNNALMRMYKQGLKPQVRKELMRSGTSISTLQELTNEAIRIDNELYGLQLEERLFAQGMRAPGSMNGNTRVYPKPRRSYPNQGRPRNNVPRIPGSYATNGYEPMHLDNLNKGPGRPKFQDKKQKKKNFNCYACGKPGHMARDCKSQGKVVRQLNVLQPANPHQDEEWSIITRPVYNINGYTDGVINGLEDLTLITPEDATSDEASASEDESFQDPEATEIDQTKFGKMELFQQNNRPSTPFVPSNEMLQLSLQNNQLRWYLNKPDVDYAYETPDIMAAMRQDFYELSQQVDRYKSDVPVEIRKFLPTPEELDWVNRAVKSWEDNNHYRSDGERAQELNQLEGEQPTWLAPQLKKQRHKDQPEQGRVREQHWMDPRNPQHVKLTWVACLHDHCTIHYSSKVDANYFPRTCHEAVHCQKRWYDCPKDECPVHLWDKRKKPYFHGHEDPQETLQMHITAQTEYEDGSAWECNRPSWHTCLNIECDAHIIAKKLYGYDKQSFLDGRPVHLEPGRRSTH